jgi:hypothetical protein
MVASCSLVSGLASYRSQLFWFFRSGLPTVVVQLKVAAPYGECAATIGTLSVTTACLNRIQAVQWHH